MGHAFEGVMVSTHYETSGIGAAAMLMALRLPFGLAHTIGELRYVGAKSGRLIALPVSYLRTGDTVVIRVANSEAKTWWRNFRTPRPASIRTDGHWSHGTAHAVVAGTIEHEQVEAVYARAHPRATLPGGDPFVVIDVVGTQGLHGLR